MPADLYLYGRVNLVPLSINIIFPPLLMYLVGSSIKVPGTDNTQRIKEIVFEIVYGSARGESLIPEWLEVRRPGWERHLEFSI